LRARLRFADGRLVATPMARQGSGVLTSMLGANGLVVVDAGAHELDSGADVTALVIGPLGRD
jgi:molybdopterin biosynthesis enzyme